MYVWVSGLGAIAAVLSITNTEGDWKKRHGWFVVTMWTSICMIVCGSVKPSDPLATKVVKLSWGPFGWEERMKPNQHFEQWGPFVTIRDTPEEQKANPIVAVADAAVYAERQAEKRAAENAPPPPPEPVPEAPRTVNMTVPVTRLPSRVVAGKEVPLETVNMTVPVTQLPLRVVDSQQSGKRRQFNSALR